MFSYWRILSYNYCFCSFSGFYDIDSIAGENECIVHYLSRSASSGTSSSPVSRVCLENVCPLRIVAGLGERHFSFLSDWHPLNAILLMVVTFSPIVISVSFSHNPKYYNVNILLQALSALTLVWRSLQSFYMSTLAHSIRIDGDCGMSLSEITTLRQR